MLFKPPDEYVGKLAAGVVKVVGATLRNSNTNKIVAHLVPVGGLAARALDAFPIANIGLQAVSIAQQQVNLRRIIHTLDSLKVLATAGAGFSVLGVGISAAGFTLVLRRLDRLEEKLDCALEKLDGIERLAEGIDKKLDFFQLGRLEAASERLTYGEASESPEAIDNLRTAGKDFGELRHYYLRLFDKEGWASDEVPLKYALDLSQRYAVCAFGQLQAQFLLGDLQITRMVLRDTRDEMSRVATFPMDEARKTGQRALTELGSQWPLEYKKRVAEFEALLGATATALSETEAHFEGFQDQINYVERVGLSPRDFRRELKRVDEEAKEPGILILETGTDG